MDLFGILRHVLIATAIWVVLSSWLAVQRS